MEGASVPFFVVFPLTLSATPGGTTTVYAYDHERQVQEKRVGTTADGPLTLTRGWYIVVSEPVAPAATSPSTLR